MKIGFIGCGLIAEPMVRSLCKLHPESEIHISHRTQSTSNRLSSKYPNVLAGENQWVLDQSDVIVLSILAAVARDILPDLKFRESHEVISVMADISLQEVSQLISPSANPCVTIPLPFIDSGNCPLPVYPESAVLEKLFGGDNLIIPQSSETNMGPHFAATALLSTVMSQLDVTSKWLGSKTGNDVNAEIYLASLFTGYLNNVGKDGQGRFLEAMKDLSTEGGLNTQLLTHNRGAGMMETLFEGLEKLDQRLKNST